MVQSLSHLFNHWLTDIAAADTHCYTAINDVETLFEQPDGLINLTPNSDSPEYQAAKDILAKSQRTDSAYACGLWAYKSPVLHHLAPAVLNIFDYLDGNLDKKIDIAAAQQRLAGPGIDSALMSLLYPLAGNTRQTLPEFADPDYKEALDALNNYIVDNDEDLGGEELPSFSFYDARQNYVDFLNDSNRKLRDCLANGRPYQVCNDEQNDRLAENDSVSTFLQSAKLYQSYVFDWRDGVVTDIDEDAANQATINVHELRSVDFDNNGKLDEQDIQTLVQKNSDYGLQAGINTVPVIYRTDTLIDSIKEYVDSQDPEMFAQAFPNHT